MALGRPAPMLTSASPGRAAAMSGAGRAQPATGSSTTIAKFRSTDSVNQVRCPHARARGGRRLQRARPADRPALAGWAALRLLADLDISFSRNWCWQLRRRTMELGAIGADADVGFAWSGGGDGAGAGRAQRATGATPPRCCKPAVSEADPMAGRRRRRRQPNSANRNRQPHGPMLGQDPARRAAATRQRIKTRSRQPEIRERKHGVDLRPFCQGCIIAMRGLRCSPAEIERNLLIPVRSLSNPYCIRPFLASHAWRYQK